MEARFCDWCGNGRIGFLGYMSCPTCGSQIEILAAYCNTCGTNMQMTTQRRSHAGSQEPPIFDPTKIVAVLFGLCAFTVFYYVPSWLDPVLTRLAEQLRFNLGSSHPLAPTLRAVITISWWLFLLMYVIVNVYQVSWAGMGYLLRKRLWQNNNPRGEEFKPTVAILIPAYNEEKHIARTLESCINQTYRNLTRIIVVDDGSTDRTASIVKEFASRDRRILCESRHVNGGKPTALNTGFSLPDTDLVLFMDGDSYLDTHAIERLVPQFRDARVGSAASLIAIHNNKTLLAKCQEIEYFFTQLVTRFCQSLEKTVLICPGAGTMVRTNIAKVIHHSPRTITEDADFTFEIHRRWRISQEPDAVSYTDAMIDWKSITNQRLRWLYGVLQTITLHSWSMRKLWVVWAWVGYLMSAVTFAILALLPVMTYIFGYGFLVFFAGYGVVAGLMVWAVHAAPLLWHPQPSKKLIALVPIYLAYQQYLNLSLIHI